MKEEIQRTNKKQKREVKDNVYGGIAYRRCITDEYLKGGDYDEELHVYHFGFCAV